MTTALVGRTGFVGGALARSRRFDVAVHSPDAGDLAGRRFEHVVFSAARAEKWRANADPEADRRHIADLIALLRTFTTDRLTLISTVDVFADPRSVDESTPVDVARAHPYGSNRYDLERAAADIHPRVLVLRLPGLYGQGLKKNVLFDLLGDNQVDRIQPRSAFQYYGLARLADDVDRAWSAGLDVAHLVTAPLRTAEVVRQAFGGRTLPSSSAPRVEYDVRTSHATVFGGSAAYVEDAATAMAGITRFVDEERARRLAASAAP